MFTLVIGNYNYSSWSMRAWLHLRASGIDFDVERIPMFVDGWQERVRRYSPAGRVPVLLDGDLAIWDSLAIIEYVIERSPGALGWPVARRDRALARSICAEMHSGFIAIRNELPQNIRLRRTLRRDQVSGPCRAQLDRVDAIWSGCRCEHADRGPWLFGELSVADVMFAPVALRLITYGMSMSPAAEEFVEAVQRFEPVREWIAAAEAETEELAFIDDLRPVARTPLTPG